VIFSVEDTGVGIKDEHKSKLFNLFGMISDSKGLNPNGTGIGLTVCQKYLEKLGGDIKLESQFGVGTKVIFWVPREENSPEIRSRKARSGKVYKSSKNPNLDIFNDFENQGTYTVATENSNISAPPSRNSNADRITCVFHR